MMRGCRAANDEETRCRSENRRSVDFHSILPTKPGCSWTRQGRFQERRNWNAPLVIYYAQPIYEISPIILFGLVRAKSRFSFELPGRGNSTQYDLLANQIGFCGLLFRIESTPDKSYRHV
jgi:hypothetical protein